MNDRHKEGGDVMVDNPKASPITRAYFEAQKPLGGLPTTPRERSLFEALQDALQKLYDEDLHKLCKERESDLQDEVNRAEESDAFVLHDEDRPDPLVQLAVARRVVQDRRNAEPIGTVGDKQYDRFRADRDATDLLEQLIEEVEAWRDLPNKRRP